LPSAPPQPGVPCRVIGGVRGLAEELPHVADRQVGCLHGGEVPLRLKLARCGVWVAVAAGCDRYGLTICPDGRITYQYPPSSFLPWPAA
jgi:hypothetical protein